MSYTDNLQSLWAETKSHWELEKQYLALDVAEKLIVLLSVVAVAVLCLTLGAMALFFLLFALASWIGHLAGNAFLGHLVMGGLLLLLMAIAYLGRKRWIIQPLSRLVVGLFLPKEGETKETVQEAEP